MSTRPTKNNESHTVHVWAPTRETYSDPETQRIETARMMRMQKLAPTIQRLVADHLPEHGIKKIDILPGEPAPAGYSGDIDMDYRIILDTDKKLNLGKGAHSVTPIVNAIAQLTTSDANPEGLFGEVQGRLADLAKHIADNKLQQLQWMHKAI